MTPESARIVRWLLVAVAASGLVLARFDYSQRAQARQELERLALQLTFGVPSEGRIDLSWLALHPSVIAARVSAGEVELGHYRAPAGTTSEVRFVKTGQGLQAELEGRLPPWSALRSEFPLVLLGWVALALVWSRDPKSQHGTSQALGSEPDLIEGIQPAVLGNLVVELDRDLRIQRVSRGVKSLGYSPGDLLGRSMDSLVEHFHPFNGESPSRVARAGGARLDSVVSSTPVQTADGSLEKVVVTLAPISGSNGGELHRRYQRMQRLCQSICDHARESILILDGAANLVYANRSFRRLLGERAVAGECILNRLRATSRLGFVDALQTGLETRVSAVFEFSLQEPCPAVLEGAFHALTAPDRDDQVAALVVGIFRDVSEARRLAQELEQSRQRAGHSQKIEALGRMAGGVAHDFNNLLATILFNLEAAKASLDDPSSPVRPYLEEMQLAAGKASSVTRQLLLYSRKKPAEPRLVSAHQVVSDAVRLTQGMRGEVALQTSLKASRDQVLLDDGQLDQVILNLIVNARDVLGRGGRIEIASENPPSTVAGEESEWLVLRVRDNGPGIPRELQSKIFEPYFTTKEVGKGTGLGLSTALAIVEKAGGTLTVTSSQKGACFEIRLPLAGPAEQLPSLHRGAPSEPADASILLVEDETAIRNLLQKLLEQNGYRVTSAASGADAAELLRGRQGYDILVTDLVLPGLSGPELAREFHTLWPDSPVLFMSGFPGDTLDEIELGSRARFLAKPFSHEQLLAALRQLLGVPVA
jgi:signal transduction histidine kinase